ncbi:MAG: pyrroline-5-carboxylate reductase [Prevotellaceae bacterium]|jgi:pyrroline-5-carboxylate reductase|nr:pyrroline-5-carboxylate reductase [Prevotellaceae bacterium]
MKITIIGVGNMGGAIARGLAKGTIVSADEITLSDPSQAHLDELKLEFPTLHLSHNNQEAAVDADYVIVAVKPWLIPEVIRELKLRKRQVLISIAAGIDFEHLASYLPDPEMTIFRLIPNIAISHLQSMTLIAGRNATMLQERTILRIFNQMGLAMIVPEEKMTAGTALTSCGIAYVLKYIQAAVQAGVEMGVYPKDAIQMVAQSVKGAAELMLNGENPHPSTEIEKICTPGGITIKGLNELEHAGFTSAIIKAMKAAK